MQGDLSCFFVSCTMIRFFCCRKQLRVERNHYCALKPIVTGTCSRTTTINIWVYKQTGSLVSLFIYFHHNYSCTEFFFTWELEQWLVASQNIIHAGTVVYECQGRPLLWHYLKLKWLWTRGGGGTHTKKNPLQQRLPPLAWTFPLKWKK